MNGCGFPSKRTKCTEVLRREEFVELCSLDSGKYSVRPRVAMYVVSTSGRRRIGGNDFVSGCITLAGVFGFSVSGRIAFIQVMVKYFAEN